VASAGARYTWMSSTIWSKPWFKRWRKGGKLLWFYLTTCPEGTIAGIFQMDPDVARMKTGPWQDSQWERDTAAMHPHVSFYPDNWVFVSGYLGENTKALNEKLGIGIQRVVNDAPPRIRADFMAKYEKFLGVYGMGIDTPPRPHSEGSDNTLPSPSLPLPPQEQHIPTTSGGGKGRLSKEQSLWVVEACGAFKAAAVKHTGFSEPEGYQEGVLKALFKRRILKGDDRDDLLGAVATFTKRKGKYDEDTGRKSGFSAKELASPSTYDSIQREYQEAKERAKTRTE